MDILVVAKMALSNQVTNRNKPYILDRLRKSLLNYHIPLVTEGNKTKMLLLFLSHQKTAHIEFPKYTTLEFIRMNS